MVSKKIVLVDTDILIKTFTHRKFLQLLLVVITLMACKSTQKINSAGVENLTVNKEEVIQKFNQTQHQYHTATIKAKVEFTDKKTQSFTANIRMVRDSIIWASLTGALGVEGARIIATKDSIFILDKLNKIYYKKPFQYIFEYVPFQLDLNFLQDLLVGNNTVQNNASIVGLQNKQYVLQQETPQLSTSYFINGAYFFADMVKMIESTDNRQLTIRYDDYRPANDTDIASKLFSFQRYVDFKSRKKINIDIKFMRIAWNEEVSFPFNVGEKYEIKY